MKITTLDLTAFESACRSLSAEVAASGFRPDIVVGIASGGDFVAEQVCNSLCPSPPRFSVAMHRPSSKAKSGIAAKVISRLPRFLCDALRIFESLVLSFTDRFRSPNLPEAAIPEKLKAAVKLNAPHILIVDDAVDSGHTLLAVRDAIAALAPQAVVRTAVITVTRPKPVILPDFRLYSDLTLVRFPWAPDATHAQ